MNINVIDSDNKKQVKDLPEAINCESQDCTQRFSLDVKTLIGELRNIEKEIAHEM